MGRTANVDKLAAFAAFDKGQISPGISYLRKFNNLAVTKLHRSVLEFSDNPGRVPRYQRTWRDVLCDYRPGRHHGVFTYRQPR